MSASGARLAALIVGCQGSPYDPRYVGWFRCFNAAAYYDAHDVLESLWAEAGPAHPDFRFWKGLIQLAGGFVHMRLQREQPTHRIHGARLPPAVRLLVLAEANLESYGREHQGLDLAGTRAVLRAFHTALEGGTRNPWDPADPPQLPVPRGAESCQPGAPQPRM